MPKSEKPKDAKKPEETKTKEGKPQRSAAEDLIFVLFLAAAGLTGFLLVGPAAGVIPADYGLAELAVAAALAALFIQRLLVHHRRQTAARALGYALTDSLVFLGLVAFAVWVLVFPTIHPLSETWIAGDFSLMIVMAVALVVRALQPNTATRPEKAYSEIEASIKQLEGAVAQLSGRPPQAEGKTDAAMAARLSTMMADLEAMRKEFAAFRASGVTPGSRASGVVSGAGGVRDAPEVARSRSGEQVTVVKPVQRPAPAEERGSGPAVPDSTVDNPWLGVLAKRKGKAQPSKGPDPADA